MANHLLGFSIFNKKNIKFNEERIIFFLKKIGLKIFIFNIYSYYKCFFELISIASIFPLLQFLSEPNWSS